MPHFTTKPNFYQTNMRDVVIQIWHIVALKALLVIFIRIPFSNFRCNCHYFLRQNVGIWRSGNNTQSFYSRGLQPFSPGAPWSIQKQSRDPQILRKMNKKLTHCRGSRSCKNVYVFGQRFEPRWLRMPFELSTCTHCCSGCACFLLFHAQILNKQKNQCCVLRWANCF